MKRFDDFFVGTYIKCVKKTNAGANVVEKFKEVSDSVWVCLKGMITEKTLKEK